jgi:hypothetical protein
MHSIRCWRQDWASDPSVRNGRVGTSTNYWSLYDAQILEAPGQSSYFPVIPLLLLQFADVGDRPSGLHGPVWPLSQPSRTKTLHR